MKYLITGTGGYVGGALARHLRESGETVLEIEGRKDFPATLKKFLSSSKPDVIVHAGCSTEFVDIYQTADQSENCTNTEVLVSELNKLDRKPYFVLIGAAGTFGVNPEPHSLDEKSNGSPSIFRSYDQTQYIHDKKNQKQILEKYLGDHVTLSLTTVFGKNMPANTIEFYRGLKNKKVAICPPGGTSYLAESDLLSALSVCLNKRVKGEFILTSGNTSFRDLFKLATNSPVVVLPSSFIYVFLAARILMKKFNVLISTFGFKYYSGKKFEDVSGWSPRQNISSIMKEIL